MRIFETLRNRKQRRFARQLRRGIEWGLNTDRITQEQYDEALALSYDDDAIEEVMARASADNSLKGGPLDFIGNIDWNEVLQWIQENLIPLLEVLFSVAILFLDEQDED